MRPSRLSCAAAALYVGAILLVAAWPTPVDASLGVRDSWPVGLLASVLDLSRSQGYAVVEAAANVVLFVPLGWFGVVLLPRLGWVWVVLGASAVSVLVETGQGLFSPNRFATLADVVANTTGALVGALAAVLLVRRARGGDEGGGFSVGRTPARAAPRHRR